MKLSNHICRVVFSGIEGNVTGQIFATPLLLLWHYQHKSVSDGGLSDGRYIYSLWSFVHVENLKVASQ